MASTSKLKLFESDDEDSDPENCKLTINTQYAEKYSAWKEKEELQKLKEKYGDVSDESSTEDETEEWNAEFEKEWLRVYTAVKFKNKDIYDEEVQFVRGEDEEEDDSAEEDSDSSESEKEAPSKKKKKKEDGPLTIRDHERRLITERQGMLSDSEDEEEVEAEAQGPSYHEEQAAIRRSISKAMAEMSSDDEEEDLLTSHVKSQREKEEEDEDYLQFLKGEKEIGDLKSSHDKKIAKEIAPLRNFLTEKSDDLDDEGRKIVWETLIARGPLKEKKEQLDEEAVEEEMEMIQMEDEDEAFEHAYNFRYEEPDKNFIKQYKRNPEDTIRQEVNKRSQKRKEVKERKLNAMAERREEIRRLKKLKQKEMEGRLQLLMKEWPPGMHMSLEELKQTLDEDFDPNKPHFKNMEEKMNEIPIEEGEDARPEFPDLDDESSLDSYVLEDARERDELLEEGAEGEGSEGEGAEGEDAEGEDAEGEDAEGEPASGANEPPAEQSHSQGTAEDDGLWPLDMSRSSRRARRRKKSAFEQYRNSNKPQLDQVFGQYLDQDSPWEAYMRDHHALDYREHGYRYTATVPNNYGLTNEALIWLPARELNAWASMKNLLETKSESDDLYLQRKYSSAKMQRKLKKIMPSIEKIGKDEFLYEDIRPHVLRQQREPQDPAEGSDESESEPTRGEDFGSRLERDPHPSPTKKRKADSVSEEQGASPSKKKKKKSKSTGSQLLSSGQEAEETSLTGKQGKGKKKKKKKLASDAGNAHDNGGHLDMEDPTENQTELPADVKKKKKKKKQKQKACEDQGTDVEQKEKVMEASKSGTEQDAADNTKKKKKKKAKPGQGEQGQTTKQKEQKKRGKKKQKKGGGGTPKVKGYVAKDRIEDSRLAAFHIDPRKFKYTKNRIMRGQPSQD